ncbi:myocardin-related transcription factor A isoform X2 [Dendropsophus ebraccatus]|uniref:myocardin-related transcription factor A isoform X2 n=1 Tax=Dendropsophus ebraccatus TaxID=150705 RepID=UPI003831C1B6
MPPPSSEGGHGGGGHKKVDESLIMEGPSAPSPKSEAIADDLQELSLKRGCEIAVSALRPPTPPLSERKNVLQLKLQQRRTREELVNQGIMPPLKSPASFHEQRKNLERARTEDYLKRKIRCRPERSELVRMHILEETSAEPSLQAKQLKLKRARLADDLNEKISQRPGPMELVVKNILPVETSLKEAIIDVNYTKVADSSSFDEDSSDALSPEQPASQDSQGSIPSPADSKPSDVVTLLSPTQTLFRVQLGSEYAEKNIPSELPQSATLNISNGFPVPMNKSFSAVIKNHSKPCHDKLRAKKMKDTKPKVKKLKYHQYIPPDQKQKGSPTMDSSYAKILQQQQLFLQLQILNQQQQQHYNYQTILPAPPKPVHADQQTGAVTTTNTAVRTLPTVSISTHCAPIGFKQNSNMPPTATKTGPLPNNLDDMKVAELKQELKQRGLHVSGTKVDLIERLKATQEISTVPANPKPAPVQQPKPLEVIPVTPNMYTPPAVTDPVSLGSFSSTPPCSPCPSEVSLASVDDVLTAGEETVSSPVTQLIVLPSPAPVTEKSATDVRDKDIMLREKDRQIEELTRRLRQKQELVERLKQQLEQEKRTTQQSPLCDDHQTPMVHVKQEISQATCDSSRCTETSNRRAAVKRETSGLQKPHNFRSSVSNKDGMKINGSSEAQVVFTVNKPSTLQAENNKSVILQQETSQQNTQPEAEVLVAQPSSSSSTSAIQLRPCTILSLAMPNMETFSDMKQSDFREEEPLCCSPKSDGQPTGMQTDDFFDNFIHNLELSTESKESYMQSMKQTSPTHPAVNEVPQSELHRLLSPTTPDRLEDFLEASTGTKILQGDEDGTTAMTLIDELHSQMLSSLAILDHPTSSMDTSDLHFSPEGGPLGLDISEPHLDSMDWLELSEPPAMNLTPLSTATPSVFSTEFLDSHDLHLQWDSCL